MPLHKNHEHISVFQLNFNSLKSTTEIAERNSLISDHDPDIIVGCESKLDNTHGTYSIFPDDYTVLCRDRDKHGEGVLIAVRTWLNPSPEHIGHRVTLLKILRNSMPPSIIYSADTRPHMHFSQGIWLVQQFNGTMSLQTRLSQTLALTRPRTK